MPAAPTPLSRLIAPRTALASCVRAFLVRDTTRCAPLPPAQRLNRFPATPMCCLLWTVAGEVEAAAPGPDLLHVRMPPALFSGPRGYPLVSYNPGPVHSFMVMLYPAALHALTGISMDALLDQFRPLAALFDADDDGNTNGSTNGSTNGNTNDSTNGSTNGNTNGCACDYANAKGTINTGSQ